MDQQSCGTAGDNETWSLPVDMVRDVMTSELPIDLAVPLVAAAVFVLSLLWKTKTTGRQAPKIDYSSNRNNDHQALARKQDFLSRVGNTYGYQNKNIPGGFIDDWRPMEFPNLQLPLDHPSSNADADEVEREYEVYLDYAGSALPTKSQLQKLYENYSTILANPHSTGPAASRTLLGIEQAKQRILQHLDGLPGRFASLQHPPRFAPSKECHAGYEVVFTSGTTEGLRIIAERFPWKPACPHCQRQSIFLYAQNSHTSVVGMRNLAMEQGATFLCLTLKEIGKMTEQDYERLDPTSGCLHCLDTNYPHLLAIPAECNFGGTRPNVERIVQVARERSGWLILVDIAKAASTGPVSLRRFDADFCVLSFYKLFGEPTGLGALLVRRSSTSALSLGQSSNTTQQYQGGGSVNIMLPHQNVCIPRSEGLTSLTNGSVHFRGILSLQHGFDELHQRGGMAQIHQHATCLARELTRRLDLVQHGNRRSVAVVYGAWADPNLRKTAGPTVALNILRDDGSFVGYNEVSKLAALHHPPMQFRTGCFCSPGACQEALGITEEQAMENYETAGHVCGDHIDLVNGQPTGAIRISFGKDSMWEDLDTFVMFLEKTFINHATRETISSTVGPTKVQISKVYVFPIKSCAAQRVSRWNVELPSGKLAYDREFALVDTSGTAMRLQTCPKMGRITPTIDLQTQTMTVSAPGREDLVLNLSDTECYNEDNVIQVCGNKCGGRLWGDYDVSEWFSSYLGVQCWLARFSNGEYQMPQRNDESPRTGFANEQALLLISENAVEALNQVLAEQNQRLVGSRHFRPNIVVQGNQLSHIEDEWKTLILQSNGLRFEAKGSCARCAMVDFDPLTGRKGKTLRALAKYRRRKGQITFGLFLQALGDNNKEEFWIQEGDGLLCT